MKSLICKGVVSRLNTRTIKVEIQEGCMKEICKFKIKEGVRNDFKQ